MRLNHVLRHCANLQRSLDFYRQLGLQLLVHQADQYARLACSRGDTSLALQQTAITAAELHQVIYFECEDVDATVASLMQQGVVFDSLPQDQPWQWREAYLRDPDGHPVCLYYAGAQRLHPASSTELA